MFDFLAAEKQTLLICLLIRSPRREGKHRWCLSIPLVWLWIYAKWNTAYLMQTPCVVT